MAVQAAPVATPVAVLNGTRRRLAGSTSFLPSSVFDFGGLDWGLLKKSGQGSSYSHPAVTEKRINSMTATGQHPFDYKAYSHFGFSPTQVRIFSQIFSQICTSPASVWIPFLIGATVIE